MYSSVWNCFIHYTVNFEKIWTVKDKIVVVSTLPGWYL
jgi:hypothetical protein